MPRNPTGEYTLPLPPVISGALIEADWANTTLADMAVTLTDSLSRTAQGSMSNPLKLVDGSASAPGVSFVNESNTGFHRPAPGDLYVTVLGQDYMRWTDDNGIQISDDGGATWSDVGTVSGYETYVDDREVTAANWNSGNNTLTLVKAVGNETVVLDTFNNITLNNGFTVNGVATLQDGLEVGGEVNQLSNLVPGSSGLLTVDTSIANRHLVNNNGAITLNITLPAGVRDIGANYTIEGNIIVSNLATPGIITLQAGGSPVASTDELGSNSIIANDKCMLSYVIHNRSGVYTSLFIWSSQ